MPVYDQLVSRSILDVVEPTLTLVAFAVSSSEAAALPNGEKALTPIIAGTISGTCVAVAWAIAAVVAIVRRRRRRKRFKKAGRLDLVDENPKPQAFIVPPDPAVVQGQRLPGEHAFAEKQNSKGKQKVDEQLPQRANTYPPNHAGSHESTSLQSPQNTPVLLRSESAEPTLATLHSIQENGQPVHGDSAHHHGTTSAHSIGKEEE